MAASEGFNEAARADWDYPERAARTGRFRHGAPRNPVVVAKRSQVLFVRSAGPTTPVGDLWAFDVDSGVERLLVSVAELMDLGDSVDLPAAERARRERLRESGAGITAYSVDRAGDRVCFTVGGRLFLLSWSDIDPDGDPTLEELVVPGPVVDPQLAPDGSAVAYHRDGQLWRLNLTAGNDGHDGPSDDANTTHGPERLTPEDGAVWGLADFIAAEELGRHHGFWWSPDSKALLVARVDETTVDKWWLADPARPADPARAIRYPAAGTNNAAVSLWLLTAEAPPNAVVQVGPGSDHEYLATVTWGAGDALAQTLSRDQRETVVHAIGIAGAVREVTRWTDDAWVDIISGVPRWTPSGELLTVRRDGVADRMRVFRGDQPISPADLQIRSVLGMRGDEVVALTAPTPTTCQVAEISDGRAHVHTVAELAQSVPGVSGGWHSGVMRGDIRVDIGAGLTEERWRMRVRRSDGQSTWLDCGEITSLADAPGINPEPELFTVGELQVAVLRPRAGVQGAAGQEPLPVLMLPYGGPHSQRVMAAGPAFVEAQWWADQGFLVVVADGRGTPGVAPSWERAIAGDLMSAAVADQVTALDEVLERYGGDRTRVGIMGWSFGGYLAAAAVLREPDRFHAAIAGAPVTEWRLYDTAYTERYLGDPDTAAAAYEVSSLMPLVDRLEAPLLLIHGLADDNVVAAHTLQLSAALLAAGKPHQVLPLSGITHMASHPEISARLLELQLLFFTSHIRDG